MAIYRYFEKEEYARAFMDKGEIRLQALSHYRKIEDGGVRGDPLDGELNYAPVDGLRLNFADGRELLLPAGSFRSSAKEDEIFVFCASNKLSEALAQKFGGFCVEVDDPMVLIQRLRSRACTASRLDYEGLKYGDVKYREYHEEPGVDWALPERLAFIKPRNGYWDQHEFRIAVGKRGAMQYENVALTLSSEPPVPKVIVSIPSPITVRIKRLPQTILHTF